MTKWKYGDSWEKYPIQKGEVWLEEKTQSKLQVIDIFDELPQFMLDADFLYIDPPWTTGNINSFYTKAGIQKTHAFEDFADILFHRIQEISPNICFIEIGKQNLKLFLEKLHNIFQYVQYWEITYYKKHPSFLTRGSKISFTTQNYTGMDDMKTPNVAIASEDCTCVGDLCCGRGLIPQSAFRLKKRFVSTELNKRRMACTIEKIIKLGGKFNENHRLH